MPFVPSIAGPVDGAAIYMAWLVVYVFLPLLMLLFAVVIQVLSLPAASLHYQHAPHPHLDGLVVIVNKKGGSTTADASGRRTMPRHRRLRRCCRCRHRRAGERGTADDAEALSSKPPPPSSFG